MHGALRTPEPKLHAFVSVNATNARLAAEAADKAIRAGHAVGPLHGIPIAIKDFVEIEGEVAMGGPRHGAIASRLSRVRPIAARRSVSGLATTQTAFVRHTGLNVRDLSASSPAFAISPASHRGREYRSAFRSR